ncbi:MAG: LpxI family protein, partial [Schwartzia sp. (in: firmicutes)]
MEKIGILAGVGHLPVECARAAKAMGYEVYAVGLLSGVDAELPTAVTAYEDINVAKLGRIIDYLKKHGVTKVTAIGKV